LEYLRTSKKFPRDFYTVQRDADNFVRCANNKLQELEYCECKVQAALIEKDQVKLK
jgi:hypothetical protein